MTWVEAGTVVVSLRRARATCWRDSAGAGGFGCVRLREVVAFGLEARDFEALADFFDCFRALTLARTVARARLTAFRALEALRFAAELVREPAGFAPDRTLAAGFFVTFLDLDFLAAGFAPVDERRFALLLDLFPERLAAPFMVFFVLLPDFLRAVAISISFSFR